MGKKIVWFLGLGALCLSVGYGAWWLWGLDATEAGKATSILVPIAGFFGILVAAWRSSVAQKQAETQARNVALVEQGQVTERFTKAVGMLADRENLAVRLGGIYALERVAKDSEADLPTVMEVLCSYVRAETPREPKSPDEESSGEGSRSPQKIGMDIQAVLTVIGRRNSAVELSGPLDLRATNLEGANLEGAKVVDANLHRG